MAALPPAHPPARAQVTTQLSGVAEAQRMKRDQIQRNCNRAAELQAQVGEGAWQWEGESGGGGRRQVQAQA